MYVLNEKAFINDIINTHEKPHNISIKYLITLIAKYYYSEYTCPDELSAVVRQQLRQFNIDGYQEYLFNDIIIRTCKCLYDGSLSSALRILDYVPVYENELKLINTLHDDRSKKFMFTLFAVARYSDCDGWINKKDFKGISELMQLANISCSYKRNELLHKLYAGGYINFGNRTDNLNIRVGLDSSGSIVYKLTSFENIGYQYIINFKDGYKACACCGIPIHNKVNSRRFCSKCASQNTKKKYAKYNQKR